MPRRKGTPGAEMGLPQMKTPELPPLVRCRHSHSRMKFSYCFSVRIAPVGMPVQRMTPSLMLHVSGAQFAFTQPLRSLPLNIGKKPSSSAAWERSAVVRERAQSREADFMCK
jgi:hypothetical protein